MPFFFFLPHSACSNLLLMGFLLPTLEPISSWGGRGALIIWLLGHTDKLNAIFLLAIENSMLATCNNVHGPLFNAVVPLSLPWHGEVLLLHRVKWCFTVPKRGKSTVTSMDCENDPSASCERGKVVQISKF